MKMMKPEHFFPSAEKERLEAAIRAAESKTSGQIVPYVVGRSDAYPEAPWLAGLLAAWLTLAVFAILDLTGWMKIGIMHIGLITIAVSLLGAVCARMFPSLILLLVSRQTVGLRVGERAQRAFFDEQIFRTRERTGILIFLSLLERRVVVLCDEGINAKVKQEAWNAIVRMIVDGIRSHEPSEALLKAIAACGSLLESENFVKQAGDTNELSDTLQIHAN